MIPLSKPYFDSYELNELAGVLDSGWVAKGPKAAEFERGIGRFLIRDYSNVIAVNNCTAALHLSLMAFGIGPGDEVLVPDFTFPATALAVMYVGATPVFVDINQLTYNIDMDDAAYKVTEKTKAIIPVHTFGQCADMDRVLSLASRQNLLVIEDAACAFGSKYSGQHAGTFGHAGCFSFHARKGLTTGEGGAVVVKGKIASKKIRLMSQFGIEGAFERSNKEIIIPKVEMVGYNYKMSDIVAAVGVAQLKKIDRMIEGRREWANRLDRFVEKSLELKVPHRDARCYHTFQSYVALAKDNETRDKLIVGLKTRRNPIQASVGTYSLQEQPVFKQFNKNDCPVSRDIAHRAIALPMYYGIMKNHRKGIK
jgi:dTDP-4-amino-4,6-dideoxygalactose transaminase